MGTLDSDTEHVLSRHQVLEVSEDLGRGGRKGGINTGPKGLGLGRHLSLHLVSPSDQDLDFRVHFFRSFDGLERVDLFVLIHHVGFWLDD